MTKRLWTGAFLLLASMCLGQTGTWVQNYDKAQALSKKTGKVLLIDFSGSDWCQWCIRLDKEVFRQKAFKEYARKNLVLMLADFPNQKELPDTVRKQNRKLAEKFGIEGYPTVILLDPDGKKIGETGYLQGGAGVYVKHLKAIIAKSRSAAK